MKRHPPPPSKPPLDRRTSQPAQPRQRLEGKFSLSIFVWTRPLAVLGGAWVMMLAIALIAVNGLLSPDASKGKTTGAAIVRNTAETTQVVKQQSRLPLWLFGAIALSCAAGSMLVSKQLTRPPRSHTRPKNIRHRQIRHAPAPDVPQPLEPFGQPPPHPPDPVAMLSFALESRSQAETNSSVTPVTLMQLAQMPLTYVAAPVEHSTAVSVTVVPSEEKSPLDWGEASLADKLDLRKQRSVSSLL